MKLYDLFLKHDCTMIEINPMAEDANGIGECGTVGTPEDPPGKGLGDACCLNR